MPLYIGGRLKCLEDLPQADLPQCAVMYDEPTTIDGLIEALVPWHKAVLGILIAINLAHCLYHQGLHFFSIWGLLWFFPMIFVHEGIHLLAMPWKADKYLYWKPEVGMAMVTMTEPMTPVRFIVISVMPLILLGILPLTYGFFAPLGAPYAKTAFTLGWLMTISAVGDIYNIYNTVTQVPKDAVVQLSGMNTYWYKMHK